LIFAYANFDEKMGIWDLVFNLSIKFGANMCNNGRVMAKNVILNMAAATIFQF